MTAPMDTVTREKYRIMCKAKAEEEGLLTKEELELADKLEPSDIAPGFVCIANIAYYRLVNTARSFK